MIRPRSNLGFAMNSALLIDFKIRPAISTIATTEMMIKKIALFLKRPKAAPVFVTYVMWNMLLMSGMDSPTASLRRTNDFKDWSTIRIAKIETKKTIPCCFLLWIGIVCNALRMGRLLTCEQVSAYCKIHISRISRLLCASGPRQSHK